nr:endothelin-converting enzyme 1-like [Dermacentor andersoni]
MTGASALLGVGVALHPSEAGKDVVSVEPPEMLTSGAVRVDINHAISLYTLSVFSAKKALSKQFVPSVYATNVVKFATNIEKLGEVKPHMAGDTKMDVVNGQSPFLEFLTEVFADTKTSLFAGEGSEVLIEAPHIVDKVIKLVTSEEAHTVLNYLCVRLMIQTSAFIPESELTTFYATMVYGKRRDAMRRWELCVRVVDKALFPLVSASLVAQLRASVAKYADLARDIMAAFQRSTDTSPYFDANSKSAVRSLLAGIQMRVFGPQWLSEPSLVDAYERSLPAIKKDQNGLETFMALHEHTFLDSLARGSAQRWRRSTFAFDCWYEPHPNTVYVPLLVFNVLQDFAGGASPLQIPRAGPRVGKCLFDMLMLHLSTDVGLDEAPEKQGDSWLTAQARAKLQDVELCLEGVQASVATGFDRFRDVLVLRAAHGHFRASEDKTSKALSLRLKNGRMLTDDQLFFIFAILQTCRKSADQKLHAEAGYEWLVALRNNDDFTASYNCSKDEAMNPDHKC